VEEMVDVRRCQIWETGLFKTGILKKNAGFNENKDAQDARNKREIKPEIGVKDRISEFPEITNQFPNWESLFPAFLSSNAANKNQKMPV
jgi:hypothetical protein